jgi:hypothetical protein
MLRQSFRFASLGIVAGLAALLVSDGADAQTGYPERSIRLVVPFAPGGNTDIMGRRYAAQVSGPLGQQIVADMSDKGFLKELVALVAEPVIDSNPDQALKFIQAELARWKPVIQATGTKAR